MDASASMSTPFRVYMLLNTGHLPAVCVCLFDDPIYFILNSFYLIAYYIRSKISLAFQYEHAMRMKKFDSCEMHLKT